MNPTKAAIADAEERHLIESSVGNIDERRLYWQEHAKTALDGKRQRISISIPERDLAKLKTRAAEEGMPYQTLINSILHKYVSS